MFRRLLGALHDVFFNQCKFAWKQFDPNSFPSSNTKYIRQFKEKGESRSMMVAVHISSSCPVNIHLFKVNNRNTRKRGEICSKLTIKTLERRE